MRKDYSMTPNTDTNWIMRHKWPYLMSSTKSREQMSDKRQSSSPSALFDKRLILSLDTFNSWHGDNLKYQQTWLTGLLNWTLMGLPLSLLHSTIRSDKCALSRKSNRESNTWYHSLTDMNNKATSRSKRSVKLDKERVSAVSCE
jgi:hypothetical protein